MRALRTHQGGYFIALLALFLQLFFAAATSATAPQVDGASLLADLATICTSDGAAERDGAPMPSGVACDHCTLCHILKIEPPLSPQQALLAPLAMIGVIYGPAPASIVIADYLKNPTSRAPPARP